MDIYCDEQGCYVSARELIYALRGTIPNGDIRINLAKLNLMANRDYVIHREDVDVRIEPLIRELEALFPFFCEKLKEECEELEI